jgi:hypothetical protein
VVRDVRWWLRACRRPIESRRERSERRRWRRSSASRRTTANRRDFTLIAPPIPIRPFLKEREKLWSSKPDAVVVVNDDSLVVGDEPEQITNELEVAVLQREERARRQLFSARRAPPARR